MTRPRRSSPAYARYYRLASANGCLRVPNERVRPLLAYLVKVHGGMKPAARALGLSSVTLWRIRDRYETANPDTVRRIVAAVKQHEAKLRAAAIDPESVKRRHERHVKRGEFDWSCDACAHSGASA